MPEADFHVPRHPAGDIIVFHGSRSAEQLSFSSSPLVNCFIIPSHHFLHTPRSAPDTHPTIEPFNFSSRVTAVRWMLSGDPRLSRTEPSGRSDWPLPRSVASSIFSGTRDGPVQRVAATLRSRCPFCSCHWRTVLPSPSLSIEPENAPWSSPRSSMRHSSCRFSPLVFTKYQTRLVLFGSFRLGARLLVSSSRAPR